ncbi:bifunctional UDP-3-O-[3-hydroxymyristoyl] N-acetylglucosamine deacetylase/3-hydroxyacyl-ACP dehydratase [Flavobacteriaceae bacterium]|nr:bifunctional UDP-3-O-[3-hydroxymyristoyl] N-acetylglucosamine deacetylase/3-hydroxyacyl-ACP dehydratase [Flavobacteriaceae bacterium]
MIKETKPQITLAKDVCLNGIGLHSGKEIQLNLRPAPENSGFIFRRVDLDPVEEIPALSCFVSKTERSTTLKKGEVEIQTTEHLLAALVGSSINNCYLDINGAELPIMDGSSKLFLEAIQKGGVKEQDKLQEVFVVQDVIRHIDEESGSEIILLPADELSFTVMIDFETKVLGTQNATLSKIDDFATEIGSSRTFSFLHELEMLLDNGLIRGGDLNNAIIYVDKPIAEKNMERLKDVFGKDDISVKPNGILNNLTLHHPNEAARHKLMDVIGDLALIGMPVQGRVIATKPGHKINTDFAKQISLIIRENRKSNAPVINLNEPPVMDVNQIMDILPHRPPFLLVDKIIELSDRHVVGLKNVTMNEPFFQGHYPGAPVMPGVLQIEAMAQAGGVLVLNTVPDPENYLTFFMKIDNVKFKRPVYPGDTLVFKLELITPIRRGICNMRANAFVNNQLVSQGDMMAQIKRRES